MLNQLRVDWRKSVVESIAIVWWFGSVAVRFGTMLDQLRDDRPRNEPHRVACRLSESARRQRECRGEGGDGAALVDARLAPESRVVES
jgi:hypothetical protein